MLTVKEAGELLELGNERNPGPWKRHSLSAAENARLIGQKAGMDGEKAYVMGLLHDIGRREGVTSIRHIFDGYDDYDRLIQLCDAISLPDGACIMEKRLVDVALRHGLPEFTLKKWRAFMETKKYFDELCGCNVYSLLPRVMENSYVSLL